MKAVIPAAGQGTRLFPQTHTKPKPMVRVAGKPILGHILDNLVRSPINDVVVVVGVMREVVVDFVREKYGNILNVAFVEQERTEGLGHSVYQARSAVADESICIALGDMLFDGDYDRFIRAHNDIDGIDGSLGVKSVAEPSNYGIVSLEEDRISRLVEKPDDPDSNLAISGLYFVEDPAWLFESIEHLIENDCRGAGDEYQLTDALQRMIDQGAAFETFNVDEWYDCGRPETLLKANRVLLDRQCPGEQTAEIHSASSVVLPPADVSDDVVLEQSIVGPYVSIDDGAEIVESRVKNAIIGRESTLYQVNLSDSLVGDQATVRGRHNEFNVGDSSEVRL